MGFYGNIADSSHVHFQFDKIFSSRTEMDRACLSGTDGIYAGRFVLVKYDTESRLFQGDILYGYFGSGQNSDILYQDTACTKPYIFTTFSKILSENTDAEDWESYYDKVEDGNFYFRLASAAEFRSGKDYWISDAVAADNTINPSSVIGINTIVRLRDAAQAGSLTSTFLQCTGTTSGEPATWEEVVNDSHYQDYFDNFELDKRTYGDEFTHRGYDATVWQKVYGEDAGRFILIASLNSGTPTFEFIQDPPSTQPLSATIDPSSTEDVYKIHVPTHWGFQIKQVEGVTDSETHQIYYPLSDQTDEYNNHLEIYMNLGGSADPTYHIRECNIDNTTPNEILVTPTGKSGTLYNGEEQNDLLELSIHLPAIGNMIDKGYDLIYGQKVVTDELTGEVTQIIRPRDIQWYGAASTDAEKQNGDVLLGGKTYDLNTFAGIINTAHNIIGQIVYDLSSWPSDSEKGNLSESYLYKFNDKYYRRGIKTESHTATESDFIYDSVTVPDYEQGANFPYNKYFIQSGSSFVEATSWDSEATYYLKNIKNSLYTPITLEHFIRGNYYLKDGDNYVCDFESEYPKYPERKYYKDLSLRTYYSYSLPDPLPPGINSDYPYVFDAEYSNDGTYFTYANHKLSPSFSDSPSLNINYFSTSTPTALNSGNSVYYYYPNVYYYFDEDLQRFILITDSIETFPSQVYPNYHILQFDDTPEYGLDYTGNIIQYYRMISHQEIPTIYGFKNSGYTATEENILTGETEPKYQHLYMLNSQGEYIPFKYISDLGIINGYSPYAVPRILYELNIVKYDPNKFFLPGAYWYKQIDTVDGQQYVSYLKDKTKHLYEETAWYLILDEVEVNPSVIPFYLPDTYWYESPPNSNEFSLSNSYLDNTQYYTKKQLYVEEDRLGQCPAGFKWNDFALYIPPSITLCSYENKIDLIEIDELGGDSNSLYGLLLVLHKLYSADDDKTRDISTVRGAYNALTDLMYQIKRLKPQRMLYVNNFGQIDSFDVGANKLFMTDENGYIKTVTLSQLKTLLNNA